MARSFTVEQSGQSRNFTAETGVGPRGPAGPGGTIDNEAVNTAIDEDPAASRAAMNDPTFNILDYGAVGDGTTDDRPGIQAALNAARDAGGGVVYIPAGTFYLKTKTTDLGYTNPEGGLNKQALNVFSNTTIMGDGAGVSTIMAHDDLPGDTPLIHSHSHISSQYDHYNDITVRDLTVDGNNMRFATLAGEDEGINFYESSRVRLLNLEIKNTGQDGFDADILCYDIIISNCSFKNCWGCGIHARVEGMTVVGCHFEGCGFERFYGDPASAAGFECSSAKNVIVSGCYFLNNAVDATFHTATIVGCTFQNAFSDYTDNQGNLVTSKRASVMIMKAASGQFTGNNVIVSGAGHPALDVNIVDGGVGGLALIKGNYLNSGTGNAITLTNAVYVTIENNSLFSGSSYNGVEVINATEDVRIVGNNIRANYGVRVQGTSTGLIVGNTFETGTWCVDLFAVTQSWSILDNTMLANNGFGIRVFQPTTEPMTVRGNTGNFAVDFVNASNVFSKNEINLYDNGASGALAGSSMSGDSVEIIDFSSSLEGQEAKQVYESVTGPGIIGSLRDTATLASGTVTVSAKAVRAGSRITLTRQGANTSTGIGYLSVGTIVDSTSFVINSLDSTASLETGDSSDVSWEIEQ